MKAGVLKTALLTALVAVSGCAAGISREELLREMQEGTAPLVVDVRSSRE